MLPFLTYATLLGLWAGLSPGPLLMLVVSHTLQHGPREGVKVAMAPLVTDAAIIAVCLLAVRAISEFEAGLGIISLVGGGFVGFLGVQSLRQGPVDLEVASAAPRSLLKGAAVNALSPHPYLFWISVGVPTVIQAYEVSVWASVGFVTVFTTLLVGSKILIAVLVSKSRSVLQGRAYVWVVRCLGALLILFAVKLVCGGIELI